MAPSKAHILREIRRLARANGGIPVGQDRFAALTGISKSQWRGRYWARWSEAVTEAGFAPREWNKKGFSDERLLQILAEAVREFRRIPSAAELDMRRQRVPDQPPSDIFARRLGLRSDIHDKLVKFAHAHPDFADVAALMANATPPAKRMQTHTPRSQRVTTGVVYLVRMGEFHKIGKSNDAGRRLYELGLRLPERHEVLHTIETDDPSGIEAYWHRRFASQRANGEWFRLSQGDVDAFARRSYM